MLFWCSLETEERYIDALYARASERTANSATADATSARLRHYFQIITWPSALQPDASMFICAFVLPRHVAGSRILWTTKDAGQRLCAHNTATSATAGRLCAASRSQDVSAAASPSASTTTERVPSARRAAAGKASAVQTTSATATGSSCTCRESTTATALTGIRSILWIQQCTKAPLPISAIHGEYFTILQCVADTVYPAGSILWAIPASDIYFPQHPSTDAANAARLLS